MAKFTFHSFSFWAIFMPRCCCCCTFTAFGRIFHNFHVFSLFFRWTLENFTRFLFCWVKQYFWARTHVHTYVKTTHTYTITHRQASNTQVRAFVAVAASLCCFAFSLFWHKFIHPFSLYAHMHKPYRYFKTMLSFNACALLPLLLSKKIRRKIFMFYFEQRFSCASRLARPFFQLELSTVSGLSMSDGDGAL